MVMVMMVMWKKGWGYIYMAALGSRQGTRVLCSCCDLLLFSHLIPPTMAAVENAALPQPDMGVEPGPPQSAYAVPTSRNGEKLVYQGF
eukprot:10293284-Karenia_brevis.AAC.1